jgi:predicted metal-dependent HD superfamily phosphohydrolase
MTYMLRRKWDDLIQTWPVHPKLTEQAFADISQRYAEPGRYYHTLHHIENMLHMVEELACHARNLNAVKLAVWLHDVIYESRASDNEERSAHYAEQLCEQLAIPEGRVVASLILKTKTHDAEDDADARVLLDADLAILGAAEPVYRDYAQQIRQEYAWVPEADYRQGRRKVLESFLSRPRIFHFLS